MAKIRISDLPEFLFGQRHHLFSIRMLILGICLALSVLGVLFVHSTTADEFDSFLSAEARSQMLKLGVGILILLGVITIDYRILEKLAYPAYFLMLVVLMVLLGTKYLGGESISRWLKFGGLNIQPSEFMKVILILTLARYLRFRKDQRKLTGLVRPFLLTLTPMVLVVAQPDLGTSLMLPPILLTLLFVAGAKRSYLSVAILAGLLLFPTILLLHAYVPEVSGKIIKEYQMKRLTGFWQRDQKSWANVNYQMGHSMIAIGSGGLTGKGYQQGTQNKFGFLPAKDTDFIFSVIGEETGFVGASTVVLLYLALVLCIFRVAMRTREPFARLVVAGIAALFAVQGVENFGMTIGLTPITGIPLPFVSYGGSSLVTSFFSIGIVLGIASRWVRVVASPDLNPSDSSKPLAVVDDHPGGANLFPNSPY